MPVIKATMQLVVFGDYPTAEAMHEVIREFTLEDIGREIDAGLLIGNYEVQTVEAVPPEDVEDELKAIGNDGDFFNIREDGE